jgi:hypothetical protein
MAEQDQNAAGKLSTGHRGNSDDVFTGATTDETVNIGATDLSPSGSISDDESVNNADAAATAASDTDIADISQNEIVDVTGAAGDLPPITRTRTATGVGDGGPFLPGEKSSGGQREE